MMRLLTTKDKHLVLRHEIRDAGNIDEVTGATQIPSYAILSHRWLEGKDPEDKEGEDAITHKEISNLEEDLKLLQISKTAKDVEQAEQHILSSHPTKYRSAKKILRFCRRADLKGFKYVWIDTCCIDKTNQAETSESINSMFQWYQEAKACFVYLFDYDSESSPPTEMKESDWFTRGWTLQELIAAKETRFYDKNWVSVGTGEDLAPKLSGWTGIGEDILTSTESTQLLEHKSIACRMSWFHGRRTTKPEDSAYCLMGIFFVNMPVMYGEGKERAFRRLQEEIMRYSDDHSLFVWKLPEEPAKLVPSTQPVGLLAPSPECFADSGTVVPISDTFNLKPHQMTNKGLDISLRCFEYGELRIAVPKCAPSEGGKYKGIYLVCDPISQVYSRVYCGNLAEVEQLGGVVQMYVKQPVARLLREP